MLQMNLASFSLVMVLNTKYMVFLPSKQSVLHIFLFISEEKLGIGKMITVEKNIIRNYNVYRSDKGKIIVRNIAITESAKNISDVTYINQDLTLYATENEIRLGSFIHEQLYYTKIILHLDKISKVLYLHNSHFAKLRSLECIIPFLIEMLWSNNNNITII